jgi:hypothetical protein
MSEQCTNEDGIVNVNEDGGEESTTSTAVEDTASTASRHSRTGSYGRQHFSFNFGSQSRPSQKSLQEYFLERSNSVSGVGVTFSSQNKLPRLPIPTLEETMAKFPSVLEALQDSRQREETRRVVDDFLKGDGPKLQGALLEYERIGIETGTWGSYVEEFWNESYLR